MMEERWLSMKEISEYLGVTRETIYKWIEDREMPGHAWENSGNSNATK